MITKQKNRYVVGFLAALAVMVGLVATSNLEVSALTDKEAKACADKWGGRSTDPKDEQYINSSDLKKFKETPCAKGDDPVCSLVTQRKSEVKVINCKTTGDGKDVEPSTSVVAAKITEANYTAYTAAKIKSACNSAFSADAKRKECIKLATAKQKKVDEEVKAKKEDEESELTDPVAGSDCGGVKTAIIKCPENNSGGVETNGIWGLLMIVLNILTAGVGIVAVGGIVYGAVLYTTAEDKADQVKQATDIITNVVIGLIAFALMWAGLNFIVPGGVFS